MGTLITDINGNPCIGIYCYVTNRYLIIGKEVNEKKAREIGKVMGLKPIRASIGGTSLVGVFLAGNDHKLLVPNIIEENEFNSLRSELGKIGVDVGKIDTRLTAFGNNMVITNEKGIISKEYSKKEEEEIREFFGIEIKRIEFEKANVPGSLIIINGKKSAVSTLITEKEGEEIKKIFGVEIERVTVNMGNPFIATGVLVNRNGLIIGTATGGAEAALLEQALIGGE